MKRREWNEEQLENLLQQLPSIKDKQNPKDLYQSIFHKQQNRKKQRAWIAPTIATVAAVLIFALISPYLFKGITRTNEESAMDISSTSSSELSKAENNPHEDTSSTESSSIEKNATGNLTISQEIKRDKQETFVTDSEDSEHIITVGLTDNNLQNVIPISIEEEEDKEEMDQIKGFNPKSIENQIGPLGFELKNSDLKRENNGEIIIDYKSETGSITGSASEVSYKESIIETFRWLGYKKANLYTNGNEGIEFGNTGKETELEISATRNKAYLVYQFDETKTKLLVPTRESLPSIKEAIEVMKQGNDIIELQPSIQSNIGEIVIEEDDELLEIEFREGSNVKDNEESIIMLESILLTAKDFGYEFVQFNGIEIEEIGVMDVTKPVEVPFSPNPIEGN